MNRAIAPFSVPLLPECAQWWGRSPL